MKFIGTLPTKVGFGPGWLRLVPGPLPFWQDRLDCSTLVAVVFQGQGTSSHPLSEAFPMLVGASPLPIKGAAMGLVSSGPGPMVDDIKSCITLSKEYAIIPIV